MGGASVRGGVCCWEANDDMVAGEGTAAAVSNDLGRVRGPSGIEKVRARAARDGNEGIGDDGRGGSGCVVVAR